MVNLDLTKDSFDKELVKKLVNTEFSFFVESPQEQQLTIEDFFAAYESLYLDIPIEGQNQSHEYLIRRSSELLNLERDTSDIEPLLNEIAKLRERLLNSNRKISELENQLLLNDITPAVQREEDLITGCTDPNDPNYDPLATIPCSDCCAGTNNNNTSSNNNSSDTNTFNSTSSNEDQNISFRSGTTLNELTGNIR